MPPWDEAVTPRNDAPSLPFRQHEVAAAPQPLDVEFVIETLILVRSALGNGAFDYYRHRIDTALARFSRKEAQE